MTLDLLRHYVPLSKFIDALPDSQQAVRYHVTESHLPVKRDQRGRIYVLRDFAVQLAETRSNFDRLSTTISHIKHVRSNE